MFKALKTIKKIKKTSERNARFQPCVSSSTRYGLDARD